MIKIENLEVTGWKAAIRGMRNPVNSWDKSDSYFSHELGGDILENGYIVDVDTDTWYIGEEDRKLMHKLAKAGNEHAKFRRMLNVTMDITAPLYWWKEYDTYKVGTVANSCSTMHKIHSKEFTKEDFSYENVLSDVDTCDYIIGRLNYAREKYLETKDKRYWYSMIQLLPSSYNQRRTVQLNYEVLSRIYHQRKNHKLDEWRGFCNYILNTLPYSKELIEVEVSNE